MKREDKETWKPAEPMDARELLWNVGCGILNIAERLVAIDPNDWYHEWLTQLRYLTADADVIRLLLDQHGMALEHMVVIFPDTFTTKTVRNTLSHEDSTNDAQGAKDGADVFKGDKSSIEDIPF